MKNRLIGRLPKVGIRPVIDGREKGVRESLEGQTMNMAKAAFLAKRKRVKVHGAVQCLFADVLRQDLKVFIFWRVISSESN